LSIKGIDTHAQFRLNHRINDNGVTERRCTKCLEWKEEDLNNYYMKNKKKPKLGYIPECKICTIKRTQSNYDPIRHTELTNSYYHSNPEYKKRKKSYNYTEEERERKRQWRYAHPEKLREYSKKHRIHDITEAEWRKELKVFNHECAYCGISEEEHKLLYNQKLHKDHGYPDGANDLSNAIPACKNCNSFKHQDNIEEWYIQQEFFDIERLNKINWWITEGYKEYIDDKPPYRIIRKQNEGRKDFNWELWTVDNKRNMIECIDIKPKKKDINISIVKLG